MKRLPRFVVGVLMVSLFFVSALGTASESSPAKKASSSNRSQAFTKPETLQGTLSMVVLPKGLIVVANPSGVPFDFQIAHAKVEVNGSPAKATALETGIGQQVSVEFLPSRSGDVAQRIVVGR